MSYWFFFSRGPVVAMSPRGRFREELTALLAQARAGSAEAVQLLVDKYVDKLIYVIRQKMRHRLRSVFDSDDFLQDVRTQLVATTIPSGVFASEKAFLAYLVKIATNEVAQTSRKFLVSEKHNLNREVSLESPQVHEPDLWSREAEPGAEAADEDTWRALMAEEPPIYRRIIQLRRAGWTEREIASALKISERTVRRVIERARARFEKLGGGSERSLGATCVIK